jgi:hypothetical protein
MPEDTKPEVTELKTASLPETGASVPFNQETMTVQGDKILVSRYVRQDAILSKGELLKRRGVCVTEIGQRNAEIEAIDKYIAELSK